MVLIKTVGINCKTNLISHDTQHKLFSSQWRWLCCWRIGGVQLLACSSSSNSSPWLLFVVPLLPEVNASELLTSAKILPLSSPFYRSIFPPGQCIDLILTLFAIKWRGYQWVVIYVPPVDRGNIKSGDYCIGRHQMAFVKKLVNDSHEGTGARLVAVSLLTFPLWGCWSCFSCCSFSVFHQVWNVTGSGGHGPAQVVAHTKT